MTSQSFSGAAKPDLLDLPQLKDRLTFLYVEKCQISKKDSAVLFEDKSGTILFPAAGISALILGPGTTITHRAIELIGDSGISIIWAGEKGVRYYASGRPLSGSSRLLLRQAELCVNQKKHSEVVRKMYKIRFPDEDVSTDTIQQLRGKEGARVRNLYQEQSRRWKVPWQGRSYDPENFAAGDPVNRALSAGNICLYGLAHAVIAALGLSPGLGFVHTGLAKSFVYDLADLYKADITIPIAFELAAQNPPGIESVMRRRVRDKFVENKLIEHMIKDLFFLLSVDEDVLEAPDVLVLWNEGRPKEVPSGLSY